MIINQRQKQKQTQQQNMTQELAQAIRILQMDSYDLEQYVQMEAQTNPMLEIDEQNSNQFEIMGDITALTRKSDERIDWLDYLNRKKDEYDFERWENVVPAASSNYPLDLNAFENSSEYRYTLEDYLMFQLKVEKITEKHYDICSYIIRSLDENGYMTMNENEIASLTGYNEEDVTDAWNKVRNFEPPGIGAKDLKDCLILQIERNIRDKNLKEKAKRLISEFIKELGDNNLKFIAEKMNIRTEEVQKIKDELLKLNPKPGSAFSGKEILKTVIPEIEVEIIDGEAKVLFNQRTEPSLEISSYYKKMLDDIENDPEVREYFNKSLDKANWLINAIKRRRSTIEKIAQVIVIRQRQFFESENSRLVPMTMRSVAEEIGVHESTVSRTVNGKYLQCSAGVYELKYFFSSGPDEQKLSSVDIQKIIKEIIEDENPQVPFSDQTICNILNSRGISIARRTVTKYREKAEIPSSVARKRY